MNALCVGQLVCRTGLLDPVHRLKHLGLHLLRGQHIDVQQSSSDFRWR